MVDDVNNFAASPDWGKVRGEDVYEGKVTYPIHLAVLSLEEEPKRRLTEILGNDELRQSPAGLEEAIALIEASGALDRCRAEARALMEADWAAFSAALPQTQAKLMLRAMLSSLLDLRFET
jgi:geranylgeranyl pyrophosphate synthase